MNPPYKMNAEASQLMRKRRTGDILFAIQMFSAVGFGITQAWLMLSTTEGVSFTWLVFWGIFLLINLSLAIRAHQVQASRVTMQTVITYAVWTIAMLVDTGVYLYCEPQIWVPIDTWTMTIALSGIATTLFIAARLHLPLSDPLVRGYLAVFFKGVPQLLLALNIFAVGGAGLSSFGIITGHITVCCRLGQLFMSLREAGFDRNRKGSLISELANEFSWIIVSFAWFYTL